MRNRALVLTGIALPIAALVALMGWALAQTGGNPGGLGINSRSGEVSIEPGAAPPLSMNLLGGGVLDVEELRGKVVMVDFWSSWCPPCVAEAPDLAAAYRLYEDKDVEFVGVAIWDKESDINEHIDRFNVAYLNGIDSQGKIAIGYGVRGVPEKFFLDREGRLVKKYVGPISSETLQAILNSLLAQTG